MKGNYTESYMNILCKTVDKEINRRYRLLKQIMDEMAGYRTIAERDTNGSYQWNFYNEISNFVNYDYQAFAKPGNMYESSRRFFRDLRSSYRALADVPLGGMPSIDEKARTVDHEYRFTRFLLLPGVRKYIRNSTGNVGYGRHIY